MRGESDPPNGVCWTSFSDYLPTSGEQLWLGTKTTVIFNPTVRFVNKCVACELGFSGTAIQLATLILVAATRTHPLLEVWVLAEFEVVSSGNNEKLFLVPRFVFEVSNFPAKSLDLPHVCGVHDFLQDPLIAEQKSFVCHHVLFTRGKLCRFSR